jgi:hypothetical protein
MTAADAIALENQRLALAQQGLVERRENSRGGPAVTFPVRRVLGLGAGRARVKQGQRALPELPKKGLPGE